MKTVIIGIGEIGKALYEVLSRHYKIEPYDLKDKRKIKINSCEIMHICIPYTENFIKAVNDYAKNSKYTVIHSSVPVGTTQQIKGKVFHSPVRGKHPYIAQGLRNYLKYISYDADYDSAVKIAAYFRKAKISTKIIHNTKITELMKLLELCRYGTYIAFAKEQEKICQHFGLDYGLVVAEYETTRNQGIVKCGMPELQQPLLYPFKDFVKGHCTVKDMELLLKQIETPLLNEAHKIDRSTVIWDNCNIYPTAKIGKGCSIGQFCEIGNNVAIGNNVRIGAYAFIPEGVTIEDNCFISPRVSFSNDKHPPSNKKSWGKILVKKGAVIGLAAIILPDVTIGENAVVGAGAIVTKDIPNGEVWYGQSALARGKKEKIYLKKK